MASQPNSSTAVDRILVYAVHPDDETLGAGGLIQQALASGAEVRVTFVTDGDNNPWPQRFVERRWKLPPGHRERWGQRRRQEARAALAELGVGETQARFLGLPDQGLTALLKTDGPHIAADIAQEIAEWLPTCIVAPALQDQHPDHNAFGVLLQHALARLDPALPRPRVLYYLVHGPALYAPAFGIRLSDEELERKRRAILRHSSQMALCRRRFLRYAARREQYQHEAAGDAWQMAHPVSVVKLAPPLLTVQVRMPALMRRLGKPHLYIALNDATWQIDLATRGDTPILDCATQQAAGQAYLVDSDEGLEISMPATMLAGTDTLYFKLERRGSFFDPAGWRGFSLTHETSPAPVIGLMPCYDVEDFCEQVIMQAARQVDRLIVVDDGSNDNTAQITRRLAVLMPDKIELIRFARNQGKGVALMAGFFHALNHYDFEVLVTLDSDGQHPPAQIPWLVEKIREGAEMVVGQRDVEAMPGRSKVGNTLATGAIKWLHPHAPTDTQSGMRAFDRAMIEEIARKISGSRYETEFQILLLALSAGRRIATVPIPTIYIDNNRSSKFRPVLDTLRIARAMIHWR